MRNIIITQSVPNDNWITATFAGDPTFIWVAKAKVFDKRSQFGVRIGRKWSRTSKLSVYRNGDMVANYDRGWDIRPSEVSAAGVAVKEFVEQLEKLPPIAEWKSVGYPIDDNVGILDALEAAQYALNRIPRHPLDHPEYRDSYAVAVKVDKAIKKLRQIIKT